MKLDKHSKPLTDKNQSRSYWFPPACTGEMQRSKPSTRVKTTSLRDYVVLEKCSQCTYGAAS